MDLYTVPPEAEQRLRAQGKVAGRVSRFFLERYPVWPIVDHIVKKSVPRHPHSIWYNMGGIVMFFLVVQIITGILMMVYYRPAQPWSSVQRMVMEVPFGGFIRSVHHWAANLMILALFMHLFSTFFMKAYRRPREFTWVTGAAMMGLTFLFGFSGYLLPWDELSFFATRVGVSEVEKAPVVGTWLAGLARGGGDVTVDTIGRFYALHVTVLPVVILALLGLHLLMIQIQGVSEPDSFAALPTEKKRYHKFFSEFLLAEIPMWLFLMTLLAALAALLPRALDPEADSSLPAPEGIKPEWYFLSQFQLLKLFPGRIELAGLALLGLLPLAILVVPFVDRAVPTDVRGRWIARGGVLALAGLVFFTVWGWIS